MSHWQCTGRGSFDEVAWDLFALLFVSGTISMAYMVRHKVLGQVLSWTVLVIGVVVAFVIATVSAIHVTSRFM